MEPELPLTDAWENQAGRITWASPAILQLTLAGEYRQWVAFQDLLEQVQRILIQARCQHLLVQQQAMTPYTDAERTWLTTYWIPRAHAWGLAYVAVVRPGSLLAGVASTAVRASVGQLPGIIRVFESQTLASQWLNKSFTNP